MLNTANHTALPAAAERHLHMVFGESARLTPWTGQLPYYLADAYAFFEGQVGGATCVFMAPREVNGGSALTLVKQRAAAQSHIGAPTILLLTGLRPHERRVLVEQGAAFIVPGNQLFAPKLGMDLRERIKSPTVGPGVHLTPAAQVVILAALYGHKLDGSSASELAERLSYTPMSMVRAYNELEGFGLAKIRQEGRERQIVLERSGQELWEQAQPLLRTPIRKRRIIADMPEADVWRAGLTALGDYTMISAPRRETWAVAAKDWGRLEALLPKRQMIWDEQAVELETWTYSPALFARKRTVDPLSLYLSLDREADERVAMAAEELLHGIGW